MKDLEEGMSVTAGSELAFYKNLSSQWQSEALELREKSKALEAVVSKLSTQLAEANDYLNDALEWASELERYDSNRDDLPNWVPSTAVYLTYAQSDQKEGA